jgi:hypothetical protein
METLTCGECGGAFKLLIEAGSYDVPDEILAVCVDCGAGFHITTVKPQLKMCHLDASEMVDKLVTLKERE